MGHFIEADLFFKRVHDLGEFNDIQVIFSKVFFQEKGYEQLVLGIGLF